MSCVRNPWALLAAFVWLAAAAPAVGQAPSPAEAAERDLEVYATAIGAFHIDGRCRVLAESQRREYASHLKIIRHALEQRGLPKDLLDEIDENTRTVAAKVACDVATAEGVERAGIMTMRLGRHLAEGMAKSRAPKSQ